MSPVYDVVILGGAFSGAATGLLLKRKHPEYRVLIIEKAAEFDRKVGEATTEVSSGYLTRVLGLQQYLGHHHLQKMGLRMWFSRTPEDAFDDCVELGARYNSRLSGFQVDRSTLDEHVLKLAVEAGCELWRPAKVGNVELGGVGKNRIEAKCGEELRTVESKWVVDASGRAAIMARKLGHFRPLKSHPTNALWARYSGVKDWDGYELRQKFPQWAEVCRTGRGWATNHLTGYGWWVWIIPLKGGDVSVGLVYDSRLYTPPAGATIADRLAAHFQLSPVGREILSEARAHEGDQKAYSMLPYFSEKVAGDGWVLAGDAAGFIDPFYSPGLDFCSFTTHIAQSLVARSLGGEDVTSAIANYNERYSFCFRSWFEGLYLNKYYYLGDAELMAAAFLMDIASYTLGPVRQVFSDSQTQFDFLPFDGVPGRVVAKILRFYNARLVVIAKKKMAAGVYGRENTGWRLLIGGFTPDMSAVKLLRQGMFRWLRAEWKAFWLRPRGEMPEEQPMPADESVTARESVMTSQ